MRALPMIFSMCVAMGLSLGVAAQTPKIPVVACFSILGDMTRAIGGEHVQVSALVGPDEDAHTYEPTPDDAKALPLLRQRTAVRRVESVPRALPHSILDEYRSFLRESRFRRPCRAANNREHGEEGEHGSHWHALA